VREASSICFAKTKFSEDVKSSGGILLGDVNVRNKELLPELKEDADFLSILIRCDFFWSRSILKTALFRE
jgi:hypothetical protein